MSEQHTASPALADGACQRCTGTGVCDETFSRCGYCYGTGLKPARTGTLRNPGHAVGSAWPDGTDPDACFASGSYRDRTGRLAIPFALAPHGEQIRRWWVRSVLIAEAKWEAMQVPDPAYSPEVERGSGDVACPDCGLKLFDHPADPRTTFLRIRCDRVRVKL